MIADAEADEDEVANRLSEAYSVYDENLELGKQTLVIDSDLELASLPAATDHRAFEIGAPQNIGVELSAPRQRQQQQQLHPTTAPALQPHPLMSGIGEIFPMPPPRVQSRAASDSFEGKSRATQADFFAQAQLQEIQTAQAQQGAAARQPLKIEGELFHQPRARSIKEEFNPNGRNIVTDFSRNISIPQRHMPTAMGVIGEGESAADFQRKHLAADLQQRPLKQNCLQPSHPALDQLSQRVQRILKYLAADPATRPLVPEIAALFQEVQALVAADNTRVGSAKLQVPSAEVAVKMQMLQENIQSIEALIEQKPA